MTNERIHCPCGHLEDGDQHACPITHARLRGNLSLAEEGLANYALEVERLRAALAPFAVKGETSIQDTYNTRKALGLDPYDDAGALSLKATAPEWKGYCQCKWDKTSSRVIEVHPACRIHAHAHEPCEQLEEVVPHGVIFDHLGWACSICGGWNHARDKLCTHTHPIEGAPRDAGSGRRIDPQHALAGRDSPHDNILYDKGAGSTCGRLIYTQHCQKPKGHEDGCEWSAGTLEEAFKDIPPFI